jgi:hypothetical protein
MILPVALRIRAILPRVARQCRAGNGVTPLACVTRLRFVHMAPEHISGVAQKRIARAIAAHTKGVEQSIVANDHLDGLIWRHNVRKAGLANLVWIIRPLIPVSDKVRHRHPFNRKAIRSARLSSGDINRYV